MNKEKFWLSMHIFALSCICLPTGILHSVVGVTACISFKSLLGLLVALLWICVGIMNMYIAILGCYSVCCGIVGRLARYGKYLLILGIMEFCGGITLSSLMWTEDETFIYWTCLATAAIKILGAILCFDLVTAQQSLPKYVRLDEMTSP